MSKATVTVLSRQISTDSQTCQTCGMLVGPVQVFHPWLYCRLFQLGVTDPAKFLQGQRFIPDPDHWGEDAPRRQAEAARRRGALVLP